jgi:cytochrome c-type biogenesis protein CcmH/NrfG
MSNEKKLINQETVILYVFIGFVVGFVAGLAFAVYKMDPEGSSQSTPAQNTAENQKSQAISSLEAEVTQNPGNFQSWVRLGDLYYDTNQAQKAIGAYTRSLELHEGTANILTDLGVMYRRNKQPEKAIEYFDKAIAMDPTHQFSRMNKGIVQYYDLQDPQAAIATWEALLKIAPNAKNATGTPVRDFVDHVKSELQQ